MICFGCWPLLMIYIIVHSVYTRCLIKCLLGIFSLVQTPMNTKLWVFSCLLIRNMFDSLVVYLTHLSPHVQFPCFGYALHIANSCTHFCYPCHALAYTLFLHPSMSCFPYALYHFVLSLFELYFSFILHPSCIIILVHTFISYPNFSLILCLFVSKRGEYTLEQQYTREFCHFYTTLVHICRGGGGEIFHRRDAYTKGGKTLC